MPSLATQLTLPFPPSINHYWRRNGGKYFISKEGLNYRKAVATACQGLEPLKGRVSVYVLAYPPDRRRRDIDNLLKALLDALEHGGLFENDSQVDDLRIVRSIQKDGGEVLVTVSEID